MVSGPRGVGRQKAVERSQKVVLLLGRPPLEHMVPARDKSRQHQQACWSPAKCSLPREADVLSISSLKYNDAYFDAVGARRPLSGPIDIRSPEKWPLAVAAAAAHAPVLTMAEVQGVWVT